MNTPQKARITALLAVSMLLVMGCGFGSIFSPAPQATSTPAAISTKPSIATPEATSTPYPTLTSAVTAALKPTVTSVPPTALSTVPSLANQSVLFQDTFDSNANNWETGPQNDETGDLDSKIVDGKFRMTLLAQQDYFYSILPVPDFSGKDFLLSMDVTLVDVTAEPRDLSIGFTLREANGVNGKRYEFTFYNDNTFIVAVWPSSDYKGVVDLLKGKLGSAKLEKGVTNTFAIQAQGAAFTFWINGKQSGTFSDPTIDEAGGISIWLGLNKKGESMTIELDDLMIKSVP